MAPELDWRGKELAAHTCGISGSISLNASLTDINLASNEIGPEGGKEIAEAIYLCQRLADEHRSRVE